MEFPLHFGLLFVFSLNGQCSATRICASLYLPFVKCEIIYIDLSRRARSSRSVLAPLTGKADSSTRETFSCHRERSIWRAFSIARERTNTSRVCRGYVRTYYIDTYTHLHVIIALASRNRKITFARSSDIVLDRRDEGDGEKRSEFQRGSRQFLSVAFLYFVNTKISV